MSWIWFILWIATLALLVRSVSLRVMLAEASSVRRRIDSRGVRHRALDLAVTDRLIREQDHELLPDIEHKHLNCYICGPGPLLQGRVPSKFEHPLFKEESQKYIDDYSWGWRQVLLPANTSTAEIVSSEIIQEGKYTGMHSIMLDIDYQVAVVETSTTGHHHLYIDKAVNWRQYKRLLRAMKDCGVIESGYYTSSVSRRATHLRPPWVRKSDPVEAPKSKKRDKRWRGRAS